MAIWNRLGNHLDKPWRELEIIQRRFRIGRIDVNKSDSGLNQPAAGFTHADVKQNGGRTGDEVSPARDLAPGGGPLLPVNSVRFSLAGGFGGRHGGTLHRLL